MPVLLWAVGAAGSRLAVSGGRWAASRLSVLLRRLWDWIRSPDFRQGVLSCVLCLLQLPRQQRA
uniref:Uncharacterized protein n=1 Tax=Leptobrachium leishanense TaxID=445787 RepID=A0A8C5MVJ1_9ANUR